MPGRRFSWSRARKNPFRAPYKTVRGLVLYGLRGEPDRVTLAMMLAEMRRRVEAATPPRPDGGSHHLCRAIDLWTAERRTKAGLRLLREAAGWLAAFGPGDDVA